MGGRSAFVNCPGEIAFYIYLAFALGGTVGYCMYCRAAYSPRKRGSHGAQGHALVYLPIDETGTNALARLAGE
jgi:hypothetical protein